LNAAKEKEDARIAEITAKETAKKDAEDKAATEKADSKAANERARNARRAFVKKCKKLEVFHDEDAAPDDRVYVTKEQTEALKEALSPDAVAAMVQLKERSEFVTALLAALEEQKN